MDQTSVMKIFFALALSCLLQSAASAQQNKFQKEIDDQVWKPFIEYFSNYRTKEFINLHDTDMVRVGIDRNRIYGVKKYETIQARGDSGSLANKARRSIEFKFYKRIASATDAFEIGLYKSTDIRPDNTSGDYYGKFWVMLKKVNGVWKIKLDADSAEGITKADWDALESK